jgi:alpha-glucosidase
MLTAWHLPVTPFVTIHDNHLVVTLWLAGNDLPQRVVIRYEEDNEELMMPMKRQSMAPARGVVAWRGRISLALGQPRRRYSFKLLWADRQQWFSPRGMGAFPPPRLETFAVDYPDTGPGWVADQVFYQIFPDRFARSHQRKPEADHSYWHHSAGTETRHMAWHEPLTHEAGGSTFYGGDLDGITEKLPYLQKLGVTALYLNPVFTAPSVHKYDTQNYREVDMAFGGNDALLRLRQQTRNKGMRLILDGVFNHTGDTHPWFDRYQQHSQGACHYADSPWREWYHFDESGQALNWLGYSSLPKLDYGCAGVVDEIYRGENSVVRHWLQPPWNMDGWRLDVVQMLGEAGGAKNNQQHIAGITQASCEVNPEAFVFGEHFGDARQWLHNDAEHSAMNYRGFSFPVWGFLANTDISYDPNHIDAETCAAWLEDYRAGLSHQQQLRMFNQLDSHDTARFKTLLGKDVARLPLAVIWLFCWPGVPCIYYGDEVGLDGGNDPMCRKPFPWDKAQQDLVLLSLYRRIAAIRRKSKALRHGGCQVVFAAGDVLVFVRVWQKERVLVALNRGEKTTCTLPFSALLAEKSWHCLEGSGVIDGMALALPGVSATVWQGK